MEWIELGDLVDIRKGTRILETEDSENKKAIRRIMIGDLRDNKEMKYTIQNEKNVLVNVEDIIIAWDGANAGLTSYNLTGAIGSTLARLRLKSIEMYPKYLGLYLGSRFEEIRFNCTGATIPHVNRNHLVKMQIPNPPINIQRKVVEVLNEAQKLINNRKEQIDLLDNLIESIFYDMFGDPIKNKMEWRIEKLGKLGNLKNGMNYSREDEGYTIKVVSVSDFQNFREITDTSILGEVELNAKPSETFLLKNGDILFVRSNGNRNLVGRNIGVYPNDDIVTFSGFSIRFRITTHKIISKFLNYALYTKALKTQLLQNIRGANIQNLNQKMLSELEIPIPTLELQNEFAKKVEKIESQKQLLEESLELLEDNYNSLIQRAFKGELF